jgi:transcriptional regulator with XRE-family HTH domain
MLTKFAEELKEARERSGMTLDQVAAKTRIDIKFLGAIESGNFTFQPELYIRAFIKDYCKALGIDDVKTLKRFEMARQGKLEPETEPVSEAKPEIQPPVIKPSVDAQPIQEESPKIKIVDPYSTQEAEMSRKPAPQVNKKIILVGMIAVVVLVLALVVYVLFFLGGGDKIVSEKPYDQVLEENKNRYAEVEQKKKEQLPNTPASDSLNLSIKTRDTSWVRITYDSLKTEEFMLYPYSQKLVKAKGSFKITLGNSAGVDFSLNDKPLSFQGRRGKRMDLVIDAAGLKTIEDQKYKKNSAN